MNNSLLRRSLAVATVLWLGATIGGCRSKVEGKYVGAAGMVAVEFKAGKATMTSATGQSETDDYTVDGDKITVKSKMGNVVFTLKQDGSLEGPLGPMKKTAE